MKKIIVLTGATGFVGRALSLELLLKGYELRVFTTNLARAKEKLALPIAFFTSLSPELFNDAHAVIHLAGEPIAENRWSTAVKDRIRDSRTLGTKKIIDAMKASARPPKIFISSSAIGFYGDRGSEVLSEESAAGTGFLADVCKAWEEASKDFQGRRVLVRTGVVLGDGGALAKMLLPFRLGGGGKLASGNQWMSWIHLSDMVGLYLFSLENDSVSGAVNGVAPGAVTNIEFTKALGSALSRPTIFPVPSLALKIVFGEMSTVLLGSQRVSAERAKKLGYNFLYPDIKSALTNLLRPRGISAGYTHDDVKWISQSPEQVFPFFSEAKNLETITPPWLNFHIVAMNTPSIQEGTLIDYKLKIKGVPARWRTRIAEWVPGKKFVDEQLKGPYRIWHHTHEFIPLAGGTLMKDSVVYQMPFGILGDIVRQLVVGNDVRTIFAYRSKIIDQKFP